MEEEGKGDGDEEKAQEREDGIYVYQLGQILSFLLLSVAVGVPSWGHLFPVGRLISTAKNCQKVNLNSASFWPSMDQKSCHVFFSIPNFFRDLYFKKERERELDLLQLKRSTKTHSD